MADKIKAMFIFEILGKPPEHIKETLYQLIDKLGELPGIIVDKKEVHEPKPFENENAKGQGLFTTFAEVEILGEDINSIINLVFYSLPSHVEIIEPEEVRLKNFEMSSLLSNLTVKLHRYDEIAKAITMERNILLGKLKELQGDQEIQSMKEEKAESRVKKGKKYKEAKKGRAKQKPKKSKKKK